MAELTDLNFRLRYRPGKVNTDADFLSRLPLDLQEYMESCTVVMKKEAIDATTQAVTRQREEGTPWVAVISASMDIGSQELIVTDLTLKQLTPGEIQQAQREDPIISKVMLYKHQGYLPKPAEARVMHCPAI